MKRSMIMHVVLPKAVANHGGLNEGYGLCYSHEHNFDRKIENK